MKNGKLCKLLLKRPWLFVASLTLTALMAVGCSGRRHSNYHPNPLEESFTLPPFLTGPIAPVLTNANDYSARMVVDLPSFTSKTRTITGNLLAKDGHLLFAPSPGDRSFIWDITQNSGYILSEALQGYAPIASPVGVTNVAIKTGVYGPILESVNNRPCHRSEVVVSSSDGSTAKFLVWREADPEGFPVRIKSVEGVTPMTIDFSGARREVLDRKLFSPPDGFTRYVSAASLRDELVMRQKNVEKKPADEGVPGIGHGPIQPQMGR